MYKSMYPNRNAFTNWPSNASKVDSVCSKMMFQMEKDRNKYFLPIISCLVKGSKTNEEDALRLIETVRGEECNCIIFKSI